jgi:hypothetical protein
MKNYGEMVLQMQFCGWVIKPYFAEIHKEKNTEIR